MAIWLTCLVSLGAMPSALNSAETSATPNGSQAETPMGIEGVYFLRHQGPALEAKPVDEKAPLALRVAGVTPQDGASVYELRYVGVRPGQFNLREYLRRIDGQPLQQAPPALVSVVQLLPEDHDGSLAELVGPPPPRFWPYRITLWVLGILWFVPWVVLLARASLRRRPSRHIPLAPPPTLADQLRPLLNAALARRLSANGQARLEMLLIAHWRERLDLFGCSLDEALRRMREHAEAGQLLRQFEQWLHERPGASQVDVAAVLAPYQEHAALDEREIASSSGGLP